MLAGRLEYTLEGAVPLRLLSWTKMFLKKIT